jgi:biopolymer transport protein ExbB
MMKFQVVSWIRRAMKFEWMEHVCQVAVILICVILTGPALAQTDQRDSSGGDPTWVQAAAREEAQLVSLRDAMTRQIQQLEERRQKQKRDIEARRKLQDAERAKLAVQGDELKAKLDEYERRQKQSLQGMHMEAARQKLRKFLDQYHDESVAAPTIQPDSWSAFAAEVERAEKTLRQSRQVRVEAGSFLDREGRRQQGSIIHLGQTAAFAETEGRAFIVAPDGKGGWLEMAPTESSMLKTIVSNGALDSLSAFVYDNVAKRSDLTMAAGFADHAAGWIPLLWLALLGLSVTGLFVAIARS